MSLQQERVDIVKKSGDSVHREVLNALGVREG